ncbi:MAG: acyltransferase [Verrucomicrobia bacterium]|nr:acyltransferase [Verrucomicrobiota bacterium]
MDAVAANPSPPPAAPAVAAMPPEKFSARRLPELDAIRGIAILLVLAFHCYGELVKFEVVPKSVLDYFHRALALGWSGVDLFFVLSGFLIGGILIDQREEAGYFKPFYIRRACRILPAYLLVLLPFTVVVLSGVTWTNLHVGQLFKGTVPLWQYFTFTQNFSFEDWGAVWLSVTWSLGIEEQFYLGFPLLVRYVTPHRLPGMLVILMLMGIVFRIAVLYIPPLGGMAAHTLLPCRWDALFLGVIGAVLVRRHDFITRCRRHLRAGTVLFFIFGLGVGVYAYSSQGIGGPVMVFAGYTWLAGFYFGGLILAVVMPPGRSKRRLFNAPLRWFGKYSYGIYLFHLPALWLTHAVLRHQAPQLANAQDAQATLLALAGTLVLAFVSYHGFEKHFLKLGHRWKYEAAG